MKRAAIIEHGEKGPEVKNIIVVNYLKDIPGCVDGEGAGMKDLYDDTKKGKARFSAAPPKPEVIPPMQEDLAEVWEAVGIEKMSPERKKEYDKLKGVE